MPPNKKTATKPAAKAATPPKGPYRVAATRQGARAVGGYCPAEKVQAFRVLTAAQDKDVQQLLAEGINSVFERYGVPERIPIFSGRRTKQATAG